MGRAERRLKEAIRNSNSDIQKQAYQNQIDRIEKYRQKVKDQHKRDDFDLNEAMEKWKSRKDLSGGKKTALDVEQRRLESELSGDYTEEEINDYLNNNIEMSEEQQKAFQALMKYTALTGTYVGQSGPEDDVTKAMNLKDELQEIDLSKLDDRTKETIKERMNELDWALKAAGNPVSKGGYSGVLGSAVNRTVYEGGLEEQRNR